MPSESRLFDFTIGVGSHGADCCPHTIVGFRITGSPDTNVNGLKTSRSIVDLSVHTCPHCGVNLCIGGSLDVYTNAYKDHCRGDIETEFCGTGITVAPTSPDTYDNGSCIK